MPPCSLLWLSVVVIMEASGCENQENGSLDQLAGLVDASVDQVAGLVDASVAGLVDASVGQVAGLVDASVASLVDAPVDQVAGLVDASVAGLVDASADQVAGLVDASVAGLADASADQVAVLVSQLVEEHLAGCHLVLATTTDSSSVFSLILRRLANGGLANTVMEAGSLTLFNDMPEPRLLQELWGEPIFSCRALIVYIGSHYNSLLLKFLEWSKLWLWPETSVVVVGGRRGMETLLSHSSLRNALNILYLAFDYQPLLPLWLRRGALQQEGSESVEIYRRCLYCNNGDMGILRVQKWDLTSTTPLKDDLFPETSGNFMGHTFKVNALTYCPFFCGKKDNESSDGPIIPQDSLDVRMWDVMAAKLNLTYEIREPTDGKWGVSMANGNWTGIIWELQNQQADIGLDLTIEASRKKVISYTVAYFYDPIVIISRKAGRLPRHLALMRPFAGEVWLLTVFCTFALGVVLWLLLRAWSWLSGGRHMRLGFALFYSWGVLLEDPPTEPPDSVSGRFLVGLWLLTSMVIGTAYRSSLIAHLAVQNKVQPINSFEDLVSSPGWSWGGTNFMGSTFVYFSQSSNPLVQEIYKNMKTSEWKEGIERVLAERFAFIIHSGRFQFEIEYKYKDKYGVTPLHRSVQEYNLFGGNAWGVRQGAPFVGQITKLKRHMIEAGLITHWMSDLKLEFISAKKDGSHVTVSSEDDENRVVLGLDHLQGAFYLLILGYGIAFFSLLGENLVHSCPRFPLHRQQLWRVPARPQMSRQPNAIMMRPV